MVELLSLLLLSLRWVHFLGGVTWIGTIFYLGRVQFPSMRKAKNGTIPSELVGRLNAILVGTSMGSIVAGVSMALILSRLNAEVFLSSSWGVSILTGGLLALAALVTTFARVLPLLDKLSSHGNSEERRPVLESTQKWLNVTTILGILVLLMMAYAVSPLR